jgi:hypothetical protein
MYNSVNIMDKNRPTKKKKSRSNGRTDGRKKKRKRVEREIYMSNAKGIYETTDGCQRYSGRRKEK